MERVQVLNEYYTNLDYDNIDKEKALEEIYALSETVKFTRNVRIAERFERLTDIMQEKISLFKSVCQHTDIIDTILDYFTYNAKQFKRAKGPLELAYGTVVTLLLTLFNICKESAIESFLLHIIFSGSTWNVQEFRVNKNNWDKLIHLEREMIILEDSDLYAVIRSLFITNDFPLYKIWVQEQVKEKFLLLMMKSYSHSFTIDTFQSLKDIRLRERTQFTISIISVWSEDIVAAKNFALSLNSHIIFINTYMDFSGGIVLFPYNKMLEQLTIHLNLIRLKRSDLTDIEQSVNVEHFSHSDGLNYTSIRNLFYNGTWQKPMKGTYWKHKDNLWANATNDDIIRCYESAVEGFKTWSIKSIKTRIQILSNLVPMLKLNKKPLLADIVSRWLKFPYLFPTIQGCLSQTGAIEVMQVYMPIGIIILKEEKENVMFFRLMQTLIAGNCVIVLFDANFCDLTPYCDMFSTCGIPPGVINLLSHEDTNVLENKLCSEKYTDYANQFFPKRNLKKRYIVPYLKITIPKIIVLHLK